VFIGVQFLLWTVGGLYFSWTNIEEIRGEHLRHGEHGLNFEGETAPPSIAMKRVSEETHARTIQAVSLSQVLGEPYYKIDFEDSDGKQSTVMADAFTGELREPFTEKEAVKIAAAEMSKPSEVVSTELLTESDVGGHHEYRDKPLPAYAITYSRPSDTIVYVSKHAGRVESVRTNAWRVFDFFWLFHTLDFYGRDNINNYVLRAFSVLGLVTIFSGYLLFFITSPWLRKYRGKRTSN
jgi:hypothetical protein